MAADTRTISTGDGRGIRFMSSGRLDGVPVVVHHGTPGSLLPHRSWVADANTRGIHLITYDRPGYGGSGPYSGRSVSAAAEDVAAIADFLGLERLFVWGISGGGPHAIACAILLPDLVAASASIASPAPYLAKGLDWFAGMGDQNIVEFHEAIEGRAAIESFIEAQVPEMLSTTPEGLSEALQSLLSPVDAEALDREFASFLIAQMREGIQHVRSGWVDDDLAFTSPWGFELNRAGAPILIVHGEQDRFVPVSHARWLADNLEDAECWLLADEGHLSLLNNRLPEIHAWLLSQA